ncbi:MAG: SDR family NAD(P)-dependent oxidoreductase [Longimicrobiales bacterium]
MDQLFGLTGSNAVVVGAGAGIGRAVALGCAAHGAQVMCADRDVDSARGAADAIQDTGGTAHDAEVDIRNQASVEALFKHCGEVMGSVDIAICTPGVNVRKPLLDYTDTDFDSVIDVNLKGNLHVLQSAGRIMKKQGKGSIILFSSIRSLVVEPGQGVYAATKAGIVQMVRAMAAELGPHGVRVNAVAPGVVDTPLTAPIKAKPDWYQAYASRNVFGRWARAEEMVGPTVFLASEAASYVTGTVLFADAGWTAIDGRFTPPGM